MQTIIGELGHISPLLTPPRQPQKSDSPTLPVIINLDRLDAAQLLRIKNMFIKNAPAVSFSNCCRLEKKKNLDKLFSGSDVTRISHEL